MRDTLFNSKTHPKGVKVNQRNFCFHGDGPWLFSSEAYAMHIYMFHISKNSFIASCHKVSQKQIPKLQEKLERSRVKVGEKYGMENSSSVNKDFLDIEISFDGS